MNKTQAQRLLDVATSLRDNPRSPTFYMGRFGFDCNTPCCALGHYAVRRDLQRVFVLNDDGDLFATRACEMGHDTRAVLAHFGITYYEANELFAEDGCDNADTPIQAAKYIERFLDEHDWAAAA